MGQGLLKNLNEHEKGIEAFLGQYARKLVNNYFQHWVWLANLHRHVMLRRFYFYNANLQSVKRALCCVPLVESQAQAVDWEELIFSVAGSGVLNLSKSR